MPEPVKVSPFIEDFELKVLLFQYTNRRICTKKLESIYSTIKESEEEILQETRITRMELMPTAFK